MNFKFPEFISVSRFGLEGIDYNNPQFNLINIDKTDYIFKKLTEDGNKGGNSIILKIYSNVDISSKDDYDYLEEKAPDAILKILKYPLKSKFKGKRPYNLSQKRFLNEIKALEVCKDKKSQNVITIFKHGECNIEGKSFLYYTMEFAEMDLKEFIEENHSKLNYEDKLKFCIELLEGLKEIDANDFYHRDIKPDNIFIVNGKWKIGDLGLVYGRQLDYQIDDISRFVGPRGWISPEVMNKYLTEAKNFAIDFDCVIDTQSDIFQMGKLFWYIFHHNAPIGTVKMSDFNNEYKSVYPILKTMLNHDKKKRYRDIEEIITLLKKIQYKLLLN